MDHQSLIRIRSVVNMLIFAAILLFAAWLAGMNIDAIVNEFFSHFGNQPTNR